jgi:hypothetical protein
MVYWNGVVNQSQVNDTWVKNTLACIIRPDLHVGSLECIWLEIKLNNKTYLYGTFYIPPTSDLQTWRNIEHSIDQLMQTKLGH